MARYKCGKLLSEYVRIAGGDECSFKICGHDFKGSSGNIGCVIFFNKETEMIKREWNGNLGT